ncbi:hypothetical protein [Polaribacter sp. M15]
MNVQSQTQCFQKIVTIGSVDKITDILYDFSNNLGVKKVFGNKLITYFKQKWQ